MYAKIVSDGQVVDACDGMKYVKWQEKNRLYLACDAGEAEGCISSDGKEVYLFAGTQGQAGQTRVEAVEIGEEEYTELRALLDENGAIEAPGEENPQGPQSVVKDEWVKRLETLEGELGRQREINAMLTECLLEMSEVVYG